jgi:hypothetical protein
MRFMAEEGWMEIKSSLMGRWIKKLQGSFSPLFEVSTGQFL